MCLAVYLASDKTLPIIAYREGRPAFYTEQAEEKDKVRAQFSLPHVYYAGSHEGCGCGFFKDGEVGEELARVQANYSALAEYIQHAQKEGARIELFSCWEGDQDALPEMQSLVRAEDLAAPEFEFKEKHLLRLAPMDV